MALFYSLHFLIENTLLSTFWGVRPNQAKQDGVKSKKQSLGLAGESALNNLSFLMEAGMEIVWAAQVWL